MDQSEREPLSQRTPEPTTSRRHRGLTIALLFAGFFAYSAIRTPVPAVNEPHYLTKAKHFWNPAWCRGDLFLESSNPHWVFYATVGSLTQWLTLEQTAWIGRIAGLLLLAIGMESLLSGVLNGMRQVWAAASLYLGMAALGNLAGEWIIGGIEGKVFAYGFAFWGAGLAIRGRFLPAAAFLGLSASFHPVVGIWCTCATIAGVLVPCLLRSPDVPRPSAIQLMVAVLLFGMCALPGLYPAFYMLGGTPADVAAEADRIQVFSRLRHHLDPAVFPIRGYICYAAMLAVWLVFRRRAMSSYAGEFFHWYLMGSAAIAAGGLVARFVLHSAALLKFYPFRLFDVLLPLAVSVLAVRLFAHWSSQRPAAQRLGIAVCVAAAAYALLVHPVDRNPTRFKPPVLTDWLDSCRWIAQNAPADATVLTPSYSWGFKWYAGRAEYVNYKDCPQDAANLLEWRRRYQLLRGWEKTRRAGTMSQAEIARFPDRELVDFVIARTNEDTDLPVAYRGRFFSVYDVRGKRSL